MLVHDAWWDASGRFGRFERFERFASNMDDFFCKIVPGL